MIYKILIIVSFFVPKFIIAQVEFRTHLEKIEGIWIESGFKKYFDENPSMSALSKSSLNQHNSHISVCPIGLRIQSVEQNNDILTIGYGVLHSHFIHPEVSKLCIQNNDTIYEQGSFSINLNQKDSLGYYKIKDLYNVFEDRSPCYLKINYGKNTTITILRKAVNETREILFNYQRITKTISQSYPYPNPRDYYVREKTLVGTYVIKDSADKVLSSNFKINPNGTFEGTNLWENQKIEFNTDVFCGGPANYDKVIIFDPNNIENTDVIMYIYILVNKNTIQLYHYKDIENSIKNNNPCYTLIRKN
jgi:hypothetical protein